MPYLELGEERREMSAGETVIGSGAQASWRVQRFDLAAKHFVIRVNEDGRASIRPSSAHNVVVVNGRHAAMQPTLLEHGDVIAAGSARFRYLRDDSPLQPRDDGAAKSSAYLIDERDRRAYAMTRRSVTIGRDTASTIFIRDPQVSRFHADVRAEAGVNVLYSTGSAGTRVNGQRVAAPRVLEEADRIEIGDTQLVFTRQPLPAGVSIAEASDDADDTVARRDTKSHPIHMPEPDTGPRGRYRASSSRRSSGMIVVMLILGAAIAAALYLL